MGGNGKKEKKKPQGRISVYGNQPGVAGDFVVIEDVDSRSVRSMPGFRRYAGNASALGGGAGQSHEGRPAGSPG